MSELPKTNDPAARVTQADTDESGWLSALVLGVLAGSVGGLIVWNGNFQTHDVLRNAIFQLGVLTAVVVGLSLAALWLEGRVRRRTQLGAMASLLFHAVLGLAGYFTYLEMAGRYEDAKESETVEVRPEVLPEPTWQEFATDNVWQPLTEPTPVTVPEEMVEPPVERLEPMEDEAERPEVAELATNQPQLPSPADLERAEVTAPRRSEQLAGEEISRREPEMPTPDESVAAVEVPRPQEQIETDAAPATTAERQRMAEPSLERGALAVASAANRAVPLGRELGAERQPLAAEAQARDDAQPELASTANQPTMARRAARIEPRSEIAVSAPVESAANEPAPLEPVEQEPVARLGIRSVDVARAAISSRTDDLSEAASPAAPRAEPLARREIATDRAEPARASIGRQMARVPRPGQIESQAIDASSAAAALQADTDGADGGTEGPAPSEFAQARASRAGQGAVASRVIGAGDTTSLPTLADRGVAVAPPGGQRADRVPEISAGSSLAGGLARTGGTAGAAAGGTSDPIEVPSTGGSGGNGSSAPSGAGSGSGTADSLVRLERRGGSARTSRPVDSGGNLQEAAASAGVPGGSSTSSLLAGGPLGGRGVTLGDREVRQTSGEAALDGGGSSGSSATGTGGNVPRYSPAGTSTETGAVADAATVVEQSTGSGGGDVAGGEAGPQPGAIEPAAIGGQFARQTREGPPVRIAAREGAGGLAELQPGVVGLPSRRARPESDVVHTVENRLILEKHGGEARIQAPVAETAVPGLKQRDSASRQKVAEAFGGTPGTERAVEMGLAFLARHQDADGSWSLHGFAEGRGDGYRRAGPGQMQTNTAGTGLALLAFLGAGYTHTDGKYREVVSRGLDFLVRNQKEDGDLFGGGSQYCWLYSHGIAAIALGEAYGMTRDERMRGPAQKALDFIAASQNPDAGGWRYRPRYDADTSVSGWQVMALKSGELAGLTIGPECYSRFEKWLNTAQSPITPALYVYRPGAAQAHQRQASRAMTAEAMLMRQYLGWDRANPRLVEGASYLRQNLPDFGNERDPRRDAYYWYYATQVMFQMQGDYWQDWNNRLRTLLTTSQEQTGPLAGSWDPMGPTIADRWGNAGGRIYVTTLHLLMLEVYYRHLPLYQTLE